MATLDDKLMGEKLHYYCSSSEDEDDGAPKFVPDNGEEEPGSSRGMGGKLSGANTGPKGVIEDWRRFKQLEKEDLPKGVNWTQVIGVGLLGGIGFTMALFIAGLAFSTPTELDASKLGILVASLIAGVVGLFLLKASTSED